MNRTITAIVAVVAGAVVGLGTTSSSFADTTSLARSATGPEVAAGAEQHTHITLNVDHCAHCPVRLVQAIDGRPFVWDSRTKRLDHGVVTFRVPTRRTHGMSFEISPRWSVLNAVPNVVTRYAGTAVGDVVTNDVARHKKHAEGCWGGTTDDRVTLDVRAVRFPTRDLEGNPGFGLRAWLKPTPQSVGPMVTAVKGAIGNQDAFYCGG